MMTEPNKIRLNKFIASSGFTSRRKADDLIASGKVKVNGVFFRAMGVIIDLSKDEVEVDGVKISGMPSKVYYLLNKPRGFVCANSTQHGDKLVTELLPKGKLSTVGRLDKLTEGLLIATNDGNFLYHVSHPSKKCEKEYEIKINKIMSKDQIGKLKNGVEIEVEKNNNGEVVMEKYFAKPKKIEVVKNDGKPTIVHITIEEGKKRQVRLMMAKVGYKFIDLKRVRVGCVKLGDLKSGEYRQLTPEEIKSLTS